MVVCRLMSHFQRLPGFLVKRQVSSSLVWLETPSVKCHLAFSSPLGLPRPFHPGGYIPTLETKLWERWKLQIINDQRPLGLPLP